MKKFIYELLSGKSDTSSKRFVSIVILFNLIAMTWVATIYDENRVTPEFMYDALTIIAGSGLGLSVIEKVFLKKEDVKIAKASKGENTEELLKS
jgi:hypothetical protein